MILEANTYFNPIFKHTETKKVKKILKENDISFEENILFKLTVNNLKEKHWNLLFKGPYSYIGNNWSSINGWEYYFNIYSKKDLQSFKKIINKK